MTRRRTWAACLAVGAVAASLTMPGVALARLGASAERVEDVSILTAIDDGVSLDNDTLFDEYVYRLFYGDPEIQTFGTSGRDQLNADEQAAYDALLAAAREIASGERTATDEIALPEMTWTLEELDMTFDGANTDFGPASAAYSECVSLARVFDALLDDCPYELYWFDKTGDSGTAFSVSNYMEASSTEVTVSPVASMCVALGYRAEVDDPTSIDASRAQNAVAAADNAKEFVEENEELGDYEKLVEYKDAICELVAYDDDSAGDPDTPYGDPWQLVSVFDGDPETNVVCEGYAKAFQYLCDLSDFGSELIRCITVHGVMSGGTGAGSHMWNLVRMDDGDTYLVDVTNSDADTLGAEGGLFLASYDSIADADDHTDTYCFLGNRVRYAYDSSTLGLYPESYLSVASEPYEAPSGETDVSLAGAHVDVAGTYAYTGEPQVPAAASVTVSLDGVTVPPECYDISATNNIDAGTATVTVVAKSGSGYTGSATGTFVIGKAVPQVNVSYVGGPIYLTTPVDEVERGLSVTGTPGTVELAESELVMGTHDYSWTFTPADGDNYSTAEGKISLTVSAETVMPEVTLSGVDGLVYDGTEKRPGVTVMVGGEMLESSAYEVDYEHNVDAGTASVTVRSAQGAPLVFAPVETSFEIARKPLVPSVEGTTSKTYDGTVEVAGGLSICLGGIVEGDVVTAVADFAFDDPNAGVDKNVSADSIRLSGEDAKNYALQSSSLDAEVGTILPAVPSGTVTYNGPELWEGSDSEEISRHLVWSGAPEEVELALAPGVELEVGTTSYHCTVTPRDSTNYTTLKTTVELEVKEDAITSIRVSALPDKLSYTYGESFDPSGVELTVTHSSGSEEVVREGLSFSYEDLTTQTKYVTVFYRGLEAKIEVSVAALSLRPTVFLMGSEGLVFTGSEHRPDVVVSGRLGIIPASEYQVAYENNIGPGTATVTVSDVTGGNYELETVVVTFDIAEAGSEPGADPTPEPQSQAMHRLYNRWTGEHLYTASAAERDSLEAVGWAYEGVGWQAPAEGDDVYRLYNPFVAGGDHHYTLDASERDALVSVGWSSEGTGWRSAPAGSGVPLFRQYNPYAVTGTHNYTADASERDALVEVGWRDEGIAWYGV